jgi:tetratricopeptide (TPR) repeat protein
MRLLTLGTVLLIAAGVASPQSAGVGVYNEANSLYRASRFDEALERYLRAAATGSKDWRLFYNLGNAHFKVGKIGEAIVWYERALKLNPRDEDIIANLSFLNRVKKDQEPESQRNPVWEFFVGVFSYPTLNELSVASSIGLLLLVTLSTWYLWRPDSGGAQRWLGLGVLTGVTLACAIWLGSRALYEEELRDAVIVVSQATARSGPDETQTKVLVIHEGTKVRIDRFEGEWALVRLATGLGGWMQQELFMEI